MGKLNPYAKAIIAAIIAGGGAFGVAALDNSVTATEWSGIVVIALTAFVGTWATPNTPATR